MSTADGSGGQTSTRLPFRADIEGLRAVAILFVVFYHAGWRRASGGFLGVDVFFVLSGYLISGLLVQEIRSTGSLSLTQFWARRARRLLPAAAVITLLVLIANAVLLSPFEQIERASTARAFAVYGSNILFAIQSTDYFGGAAARDPLLHTWSLSVEEQFYIVFAPSLLLLAMWAMKRGRAVFDRSFLLLTAFISVASFAGCLLLVRTYPSVAFYILPARAWEFGIGALTVLAVEKWVLTQPAAVEGLSVAALMGLIGSAMLVHDAAPLGVATLVPALSAAVLIHTGAAAHRSLVARLLSTAPMRLLGRLSYSWYLWHWPALVYLREVRPNPSLKLSVAVAFASLIPASITYALVESPIRFSRGLQQRHAQVVFGAVVLALLTLGAGSLAIWRSNATLATPRFAAILAARTPSHIYSDGCQVPLMEEVSPPCTFGPARSDTTIALFGDSHAAQWFPAFDSLAALRGWKFVNLTKSGCPSLDIGVWNAKLGRRYLECDRWRANTLQRIATLHPTFVVLTNDHTYNVMFGDKPMRGDSTRAGIAEWTRAVNSTLASLAGTGARLVVLQDTPRPGFDVPRCLVKYVDTPAGCAFKRRRAADTLIATGEREAVRAARNAAYISLNSVICDDTRCEAQADGVVRYRDEDHLTTAFATSLVSELSRALTRAITTTEPR